MGKPEKFTMTRVELDNLVRLEITKKLHELREEFSHPTMGKSFIVATKCAVYASRYTLETAPGIIGPNKKIKHLTYYRGDQTGKKRIYTSRGAIAEGNDVYIGYLSKTDVYKHVIRSPKYTDMLMQLQDRWVVTLGCAPKDFHTAGGLLSHVVMFQADNTTNGKNNKPPAGTVGKEWKFSALFAEKAFRRIESLPGQDRSAEILCTLHDF